MQVDAAVMQACGKNDAPMMQNRRLPAEWDNPRTALPRAWDNTQGKPSR